MNSLSIWKTITVALLLIIILVVGDFLLSFLNIDFSIFFDNQNQFSYTSLRTIGFALLASIIIVSLGFLLALLILKVKLFSKLGVNLSFMILPVTLGNISIAFICKLLLGDTAFFAMLIKKGVSYQFLFLIFLQFWQFGILFTYLFWMALQNIPQKFYTYALATNFSSWQKLKDIYIPQTKNLWMLLLVIGFVFTLFEESKLFYLFKVSQGTNSELITNWLARNYQSAILINPNYAKNIIYNASNIVFILSLVALVILALLFLFILRSFSIAKLYFDFKNSVSLKLSKSVAYIISLILLAIIILPIVSTFFKLTFKIDDSISELGFTLLMTLIASLLASVVAITLAISSRIAWRKYLLSFNTKSLFFIIALYLILLIPPIVIQICGYKWMSLIGYNSITGIYIIWLLSHTILSLPVLGSFSLFNHFRVSNNELDYIQLHQLSKLEIIKYSFIKRFKAEYFLLVIIAFSFIWNEAILNNLFSDYIPSFASGMKMLITGRAADYSKAFGYLIVSIALSITASVIWRSIIIKGKNQTNPA
jgi:ABC-type sugar transport system permease subunit